jgi:hypothetical protein
MEILEINDLQKRLIPVITSSIVSEELHPYTPCGQRFRKK